MRLHRRGVSEPCATMATAAAATASDSVSVAVGEVTRSTEPHSSKLKLLLQMMEPMQAAGDRVVIASQFQACLT